MQEAQVLSEPICDDKGLRGGLAKLPVWSNSELVLLAHLLG